MLASIRRFAKSPWATGLMALLVMSFAVFGIRDVFNSGAVGDAVVKVGGRTITSAQFRAMFDRYLQGAAQQNGGKAISIPEAVSQGLDARALNEVAYEESTAALITKLGVRPADALVADELGKAQRFRDPVTGKFDETAYKTFLRENNTSAAELEGSIRDQIAQQHFLTGLVAGLQAPFAYTAVQAAYNGETRSFSYVALTPSMVPTPPKPTDAELQAFMKANAQAFMRPEVRTVSLVRFSAALLAPTLTLDPAEVQKRFAFEKDSLSTPEKRSLVQIPLKSAAQSADAVARLERGQDPSLVAKAVGTQAVVLTDTPATAIPDRAVADAAFAMKPGEVRAVTGALAPSVVKLTAVAPGKAVTLDDVRAKIEDETRRAAAAAKAQDLASKYDDAKSKGGTLQDAAAKVGATVTALPPFTAQGTDAKGQHIPAPEKLVQTAFSLAQGGESDVLQAAPGEFYAIRVEKVAPAAPVPLDEVRAPLTQRLMLTKLAAALQAKADALSAQATKEGNLDGVAKAVGASVQHATGVTRAAQNQANAGGFGPRLLGAVFGAKPGAVVAAPDKLTLVVAKVDQVASAPVAALVQASQAARSSATLGLYDDVASHAREAARVEMKPRVDPKRARSALGLDDSGAGGRPRPRRPDPAPVRFEPAADVFAQAFAEGRAQVVWTRLIDDLETPVSAYLKVGLGRPNSFLFESVEGGAWRGRYSILALSPDLVWRARGEVAETAAGEAAIAAGAYAREALPTLESLRALIAASRIDLPPELPPMAAGVFGVLGYDVIRLAEPLGPANPDPLDLPDAILMRPQVVAIFDGVAQEIVLVTPVRPSDASAQEARAAAEARLAAVAADLRAPAPRRSEPEAPSAPLPAPASPIDRAAYGAMVEAAKRYIAAGDIFQVVPSHRFSGPYAGDPFAFYRALRRVNPSPFLYFLDFGGFQLAGSSPEILVRYRDGRVTIRPIAGTRRRGATPAEDVALEAELLADEKERAEHLMLLDLGRNDVGRAIGLGRDGDNRAGEVKVTQAFGVERYSHVMHIVSNVEGEATRPLDPVDVILTALPAGTLSGAPKVRAMQIIDDLESVKRGLGYGGAAGYIGAGGDVDTCIVLRTALFKDGAIHVQSGGGVVADSDPDAEYEETLHKVQALAKAAQEAWRFE